MDTAKIWDRRNFQKDDFSTLQRKSFEMQDGFGRQKFTDIKYV